MDNNDISVTYIGISKLTLLTKRLSSEDSGLALSEESHRDTLK